MEKRLLVRSLLWALWGLPRSQLPGLGQPLTRTCFCYPQLLALLPLAVKPGAVEWPSVSLCLNPIIFKAKIIILALTCLEMAGEIRVR